MCECGCGNELGNSPSMFFKWSICQSLWMLSQQYPDPAEWRARERENLIFAHLAPYWHPSALSDDITTWEFVVRNQYAWVVWEKQTGLSALGAPKDFLPSLEKAMQHLIVDWYAARERWVETGHYGTELYEPRFLIPAKV